MRKRLRLHVWRMSKMRSFVFIAVLFSLFYFLLNVYTPSSGTVHNPINRVMKYRFIPSDSTPSAQLQYNTTPAILLNNKTQLSDNLTKKKTTPVQLIIITRWRSGSSFAGELFNNNPEFAYFFEPLIGLSGGNSGVQFGQSEVDFLHRILACNFTGTNHTWWSGQWSINCGKSLTFSRTLLCEYFRNVRDLGPRTNRTNVMVEEICRSRRHVAIKTVRVPDIAHMRSMVSDPTLNVKVINLIRDPRAVFVSRQKTDGVNDMPDKECDEMESNLRFWKDPPHWLKNRHMLLRYEDLAEDPLFITDKIYKFLGLSVPAAVKFWLEYNTNWDEVGEYSRARVSDEAAHRWRYRIDYKTMVGIQRHCIVPLIMAGYIPITSQKDLLNMTIPTLNKFPYPLLPNITHVEDDNLWDNSEVSSVVSDNTNDDETKENISYSSSS